jgi:hypothetical protein
MQLGRIVYHWQNDHQSQPVQQPVPQPIYHPVQQQSVYQPVQQAFYQPVQYPSQEPVEQFTQQPIPRARNDSGNEDDHAIETGTYLRISARITNGPDSIDSSGGHASTAT